jgi:hypothetical protein
MTKNEENYTKVNTAMASYFENITKQKEEQSINESAMLKAAELLMTSNNQKRKRKGEKLLEKYAEISIRKLECQLKSTGESTLSLDSSSTDFGDD